MSRRSAPNPSKQQWQYVVLNRTSAGWPLSLSQLTAQLDAGIASGLSVDSPELAAQLLDVGFKPKSLVCNVIEAATTHMDPDNAITLLHLLSSRHAQFAGAAHDPLEHLLNTIDYEEQRPDLTPVAATLLELGADLCALVDRRGMEWIRETLEGNMAEETADFLEGKWKLLHECRELQERTPQSPVQSRIMPRL